MFKSVIAALGQRELLGQGQRPQSSTTPPMLQNQPSPQAIPLCTSATQTGCAIVFSSFSSQPPANSVFGRPGQGTSLDPCLLTAPQIQAGLKEPVHTPWVTYPGLYSATCEHGGGATWLQVTSLTGTSHTRPVVTEDILPGTLDTGPAWGYHGYETTSPSAACSTTSPAKKPRGSPATDTFLGITQFRVRRRDRPEA